MCNIGSLLSYKNNVERVVELIDSDMELLNMTIGAFGTLLQVAAS